MFLSRVTTFLAVILTPPHVAFRVGSLLGSLRYMVASSRRVARIRAAMQTRLDLQPDEAERLVRSVFERARQEQLEGGFFRFKSRQAVSSLVEIRGLESLDSALERGHGCILYSGHFRGRWAFAAKLGLAGYHPVVVRKRHPRNLSRLSRWRLDRFDAMVSQKFGVRYLWIDYPGRVGVQAAAHLRKNGLLLNFVDLNSPDDHAVRVEFLRRLQPFSPGTVRLSHATGASMLKFSTYYSPSDGRYIGEIGPARIASRDWRKETQELARQLEASVLSYPEDWSGWERSQILGSGASGC